MVNTRKLTSEERKKLAEFGKDLIDLSHSDSPIHNIVCSLGAENTMMKMFLEKLEKE